MQEQHMLEYAYITTLYTAVQLRTILREGRTHTGSLHLTLPPQSWMFLTFHIYFSYQSTTLSREQSYDTMLFTWLTYGSALIVL